jgi:hypothetical protein
MGAEHRAVIASMAIILGIDPGLQKTGFGIIIR